VRHRWAAGHQHAVASRALLWDSIRYRVRRLVSIPARARHQGPNPVPAWDRLATVRIRRCRDPQVQYDLPARAIALAVEIPDTVGRQIRRRRTEVGLETRRDLARRLPVDRVRLMAVPHLRIVAACRPTAEGLRLRTAADGLPEAAATAPVHPRTTAVVVHPLITAAAVGPPPTMVVEAAVRPTVVGAVAVTPPAVVTEDIAKQITSYESKAPLDPGRRLSYDLDQSIR